MNEPNSTETHSDLNAVPLSDQTKFRLNEINKIKYNFSSEIQERKTMSKKLSKHIAAFDYIDKTLNVLSATNRRISIISFTNVIEVPAGLISASFTLIFSLTTGMIKKLLLKKIVEIHGFKNIFIYIFCPCKVVKITK